MKLYLAIALVIIWLYVLHVLKRAEVYAWRFLWGSMGFFAFMMVFVQPILWEPLARGVSALAGVIGRLTDTFTTYFKYAIIYIPSRAGSITLKVDFECSGIVEILAFLSLLMFFDIYNLAEKVTVGIAGSCYIIVCNALRITMICLSVHYFGLSAYYVVHTYIGRLFFYTFSVLLYFYVFTKPQIIHMKVGSFTYGNTQKTP